MAKKSALIIFRKECLLFSFAFWVLPSHVAGQAQPLVYLFQSCPVVWCCEALDVSLREGFPDSFFLFLVDSELAEIYPSSSMDFEPTIP